MLKISSRRLTMGAVLILAGGFPHFYPQLSGVSSVSAPGGMGEVVFNSYGNDPLWQEKF